MKKLNDLGVIAIMLLMITIGGSIVVTILFLFWLLAAFICIVKMQRPPTIKEFLNL